MDFNSYWNKNRAHLLKVLTFHVKDQDLAEDILQNTAIELWNNIQRKGKNFNYVKATLPTLEKQIKKEVALKKFEVPN